MLKVEQTDAQAENHINDREQNGQLERAVQIEEGEDGQRDQKVESSVFPRTAEIAQVRALQIDRQRQQEVGSTQHHDIKLPDMPLVEKLRLGQPQNGEWQRQENKGAQNDQHGQPTLEEPQGRPR